MKFVPKIKSFTRTVKKEIRLYRLILKDRRTPLFAKVLLGAAIGYLLLPFDLIPDFIPVFGQIDDVIIVPGLVYCALKIIPKDIIVEHRKIINNNEPG